MFHVKHRQEHMKRKQKQKRHGLRIAGILCLLLAAVLAWCHITAVVIHLRRTVILSHSVPPSFDGIRILYLTDIDVHTALSANACKGLAERLKRLSPDLVILGGDLASPLLFSGEDRDATDNRAAAVLEAFSLIDPPLGTYIVTGEEDNPDTISAVCAAYGFTYADGKAVRITTGNDTLCVCGIGQERRNAKAKENDFVIAVSHDPGDAIPVLTAEAEGGGGFADLILCGHTHGGQVRIAGKELLDSDIQADRIPAGWHETNGIPVLHSMGVGCKGLLLRFGTSSEAHLIELRRESGENGLVF